MGAGEELAVFSSPGLNCMDLEPGFYWNPSLTLSSPPPAAATFKCLSNCRHKCTHSGENQRDRLCAGLVLVTDHSPKQDWKNAGWGQGAEGHPEVLKQAAGRLRPGELKEVNSSRVQFGVWGGLSKGPEAWLPFRTLTGSGGKCGTAKGSPV